MGAASATLAWTVLAVWLLLLLDRRRSWPAGIRVEPDTAGAGGPPAPAELPEVAAIVPARDEAAVLPDTLPDLLRSEYPRFRVVLVDDRSSDGTSAAAREIAGLAGRSDRLLVVEGSPPPPGWSGKVHALQTGLHALESAGGASATGGASAPEWLLLTDADIRHHSRSVLDLMARARAGGHQLVSVMARLRAAGFWERLIIPAFVFFFHLLYPFRLVSKPGARLAAAAGGCILISRRALEAAGGFTAIAGEIIDDLALARAVRRSGGSLWLGLDPGIESARGYAGLPELWRMVSRTAFTQLRRRYDLLVLTAVLLVVVVILPPLLLALELAAGRPLSAAAAAGAWLIQAALLFPSVRHHRVSPAYAFTLPAAGLLYLLMTLSSAWDHWRGRGPLWRGRRYAASRRAV